MKNAMNYWKTDDDPIVRFGKGFSESCSKSYLSAFQTTRHITSGKRKGKVKRK